MDRCLKLLGLEVNLKKNAIPFEWEEELESAVESSEKKKKAK